MKKPYLISLLLIALTGCGSGVHPNDTVYPNLTGNWQVQTVDGGPSIGLLLVGSMVEGTDGTMNGKFRFADLDSTSSCGSGYQTVSLSGARDTTGAITLKSSPLSTGSIVNISLVARGVTNAPNYGTILITGTGCTYPSSPAIGIVIAPITGSYSGVLAREGTVSGLANGNATLALTQSTSPAADGEFPMTGSINFVGANCSASLSVAGTVSGENLQLTSPPDPITGVSELQITAFPDSKADQLANATLVFATGSCSSGISPFNTYTGTLAK